MHSDILDELYRQYYGAALLYVLSLCRDRALAEELVHDAFVKAYLSLPDDAPSFPFWLMKVCRNLWYDYARRQKFLADEEPPEQTDATTPETLLLQKEEAAQLWRAIGRLDTADRELLTLHYFAARPTQELSALLGLSPATARQRLHRARLKLRRILEEDGYEI
jgi:RNA polymerase sigma-70 factor (ECF subfamily)